MGNYIAHTRRRIKRKKTSAIVADAAVIAAHEHEMAVQREARRAQLERARAEKEARARERAAKKRASVVDLDRSGRKRTAVRAAGIVLISATAGLRTRGISVWRAPGSPAENLWCAKIDFDIEEGFTHYINDPATPAGIDAIHAMRALAPGIAERLVLLPVVDDGVDENNIRTACRLAESYMLKTHDASSLTVDAKRDLSLAILDEFRAIAALRLGHLRTELDRIADSLTHKTKMSRSECDAALAGIYDGFEDFCRGKPRPALFCAPHEVRAPPPARGFAARIARPMTVSP